MPSSVPSGAITDVPADAAAAAAAASPISLPMMELLEISGADVVVTVEAGTLTGLMSK